MKDNLVPIKQNQRFSLLLYTLWSSIGTAVMLGLTLLVLFLTVVPNLFSNVAPLMLFVALIILVISIYATSLPLRDLLKGQAATEEGIGVLNKRRVYRGGIQHHFAINGKEFRITKKQYNQLYDSTHYQVYYAPHSNLFFEAIRIVSQ